MFVVCRVPSGRPLQLLLRCSAAAEISQRSPRERSVGPDWPRLDAHEGVSPPVAGPPSHVESLEARSRRIPPLPAEGESTLDLTLDSGGRAGIDRAYQANSGARGTRKRGTFVLPKLRSCWSAAPRSRLVCFGASSGRRLSWSRSVPTWAVRTTWPAPLSTHSPSSSRPNRWVARTVVRDLCVGGGGGSRTRVREYVPTGIYMRIRACCFATRVRARLKPRAAERQKISLRPVVAPGRSQPAE